MTSYKVIDLQGASAGVVVDGEWVSFISAVCTEYCRHWSGINAISTYTNLCCTQYTYTMYSTLYILCLICTSSRSETVLKTAPTPPRGESDGSPHSPAPPITRVTFSS